MKHERGKCCVCKKPADAIIAEALFCARHARDKQLSSVRQGSLHRRRDMGDPRERRFGMRERRVLAGAGELVQGEG